jgi:uracil-DNA glycosylase
MDQVKSSEDFSTLNPSKNRRCKACGLYLNQLPALDITKNAQVFWVGLSSVLFLEGQERLPLSPLTKSGALIDTIEKPFLNYIGFYRTNIVKCLPLNENRIRYPIKTEMEKCYPNLIDEIDVLKPSHMFLLGKQVSDFILGKQELTVGLLSDSFNYSLFYKNGVRYIPIHHPSFILVYKRKSLPQYILGIQQLLKNIGLV